MTRCSIYLQVFRYARGHLKIRFRKMNHNILLPIQEPVQQMETDEIDENRDQRKHFRTIRHFGK